MAVKQLFQPLQTHKVSPWLLASRTAYQHLSVVRRCIQGQLLQFPLQPERTEIQRPGTQRLLDRTACVRECIHRIIEGALSQAEHLGTDSDSSLVKSFDRYLVSDPLGT